METHVNQNSRQSSGINIGSASIIMVFSVLCLTVFAVLTFMTANGEYKLSVKSADSIKSYYAADTRATETYAKIQEIVSNPAAEVASYGYISNEVQKLGVKAESAEDGLLLSYSEKMSEGRELMVKLKLNGSKLSVETWKLVSTNEWNGSGPTLWDGEF